MKKTSSILMKYIIQIVYKINNRIIIMISIKKIYQIKIKRKTIKMKINNNKIFFYKKIKVQLMKVYIMNFLTQIKINNNKKYKNNN